MPYKLGIIALFALLLGAGCAGTGEEPEPADDPWGEPEQEEPAPAPEPEPEQEPMPEQEPAPEGDMGW